MAELDEKSMLRACLMSMGLVKMEPALIVKVFEAFRPTPVAQEAYEEELSVLA